MFYGVYYYQKNGGYTYVIRHGFYQKVTEAINALGFVIPDFAQYSGNTVANKTHVGWINAYQFGSYPSGDNPINQPSIHSINIFSAITEESLVDNMNSKLILSNFDLVKELELLNCH